LVSRTREGVVGLHLVTPFRLADGRTLLIDRGWLPPEALAPESRPESLLEGEVSQVGLVRLGGWSGSAWLEPTNDPAGNRWLWLDLPAMAAAAGLERPITDFYLAALPGQHPGIWPEGGRTRIAISDNHLEYALTWFALAVVLLAVFLVWRRRPA
ncbi:MAG: SURF1 family cytochrome oxidase biogenesis protein, partial [Tistlia sp.]